MTHHAGEHRAGAQRHVAKPHRLFAQAQRAVATNGIDRFVGNLGAAFEELLAPGPDF